jgi:hypothetical protein
MSYHVGIDTIHLRPTPRLAHTESCTHARLREAVVQATGETLEDAWAYDLILNTDDGPVPWPALGRVTDMGHAEFLEGGVDRRDPKPCPFTHVDQVLTFDAVEEYGLPEFDALVRHYEQVYREGQDAHPNQVFTGGYYKTMLSGALEAFGWEMLLLAAADPAAFERVLDSLFRLSLHHYKAWAKTSVEVFIAHDDMVWTQGAFMDPAFYRSVLFPRYAELCRVLKDAGKKVLFCSDGNWTEFIDDIARAGAGGFIIEPTVSLTGAVASHGATHVIVGSKMD